MAPDVAEGPSRSRRAGARGGRGRLRRKCGQTWQWANARIQLRSRRAGAVASLGALRGFVRCNDSLGGRSVELTIQVWREVDRLSTSSVRHCMSAGVDADDSDVGVMAIVVRTWMRVHPM